MLRSSRSAAPPRAAAPAPAPAPRRPGRSRRALALAAVVALTGVAATGVLPAAARADGDPPLGDPGIWRIVLALGHGSADAAVEVADELARLSGAVAERLTFDTRTRTFLERLRARLVDLDLGELYEMFPGRSSDLAAALREREVRALGVRGGRDADTYRLTFFPGTGDRGWGEVSRVGALAGELALRPVALPEVDARGFRLNVRGSVGTGRVGHHEVGALVEGFLRAVEEIGRREGDVGEAAATAARRHQRGLTRPSDVQLYTESRRVLPSTTRFVDRFVPLQRVGAPASLAPGAPFRIDLRGSVSLEAFRAPFPELYDYLTGLGDLLDLDMTVLDRHGHRLARLHFESRSLRLNVEALVKDGALVPETSAREPAPCGPVSFTTTTDYAFRLVTRATVRHLGLVIDLRQYAIDMRYTDSGERGRFATRLREVPRVEYSGRVLGVLPLWALDAVIPSDIDRHTRDFLTALAHGTDGRGASAEAEVRTAGVASEAAVRLDAVALDNALVSLALGIVGRRVQPDPDAQKDVERFWGEFFRNFRADWARARPVVSALR